MNAMEITKHLKCNIDFNQTELTNAISKHQVKFYFFLKYFSYENFVKNKKKCVCTLNHLY